MACHPNQIACAVGFREVRRRRWEKKTRATANSAASSDPLENVFCREEPQKRWPYPRAPTPRPDFRNVSLRSQNPRVEGQITAEPCPQEDKWDVLSGPCSLDVLLPRHLGCGIPGVLLHCGFPWCCFRTKAFTAKLTSVFFFPEMNKAIALVLPWFLKSESTTPSPVWPSPTVKSFLYSLENAPSHFSFKHECSWCGLCYDELLFQRPFQTLM